MKFYDLYEHATGSRIVTCVGAIEMAQRHMGIAPYDLEWAVEETGRCDVTLEDLGLGEGHVVAVPTGNPYPGPYVDDEHNPVFGPADWPKHAAHPRNKAKRR